MIIATDSTYRPSHHTASSIPNRFMSGILVAVSRPGKPLAQQNWKVERYRSVKPEANLADAIERELSLEMISFAPQDLS